MPSITVPNINKGQRQRQVVNIAAGNLNIAVRQSIQSNCQSSNMTIIITAGPPGNTGAQGKGNTGPNLPPGPNIGSVPEPTLQPSISEPPPRPERSSKNTSIPQTATSNNSEPPARPERSDPASKVSGTSTTKRSKRLSGSKKKPSHDAVSFHD